MDSNHILVIITLNVATYTFSYIFTVYAIILVLRWVLFRKQCVFIISIYVFCISELIAMAKRTPHFLFCFNRFSYFNMSFYGILIPLHSLWILRKVRPLFVTGRNLLFMHMHVSPIIHFPIYFILFIVCIWACISLTAGRRPFLGLVGRFWIPSLILLA